ncbi:MAG: TerB family tellurite resistance protein [Cyanobacteria bacterium]|nr:TerB family tellurite resistance protein [Cyanobacteriota bacterium]MDW8202750.1 Mo-dependent nitrogenase C-terminal domain-containing protein [Cyanobacteriota bacterium SKYGB_h_bin112]
MTSNQQPSLNDEQISAWLRGLMTIAWADGDFDDSERSLIADLTHDQSVMNATQSALDPITPQELDQILGHDPNLAENFLRTAVMVAIADGVYSPPEDAVLTEFCQTLGLKVEILAALRSTLEPLTTESPASSTTQVAADEDSHSFDLLNPLRDWLDRMEIHDPRVARFLCKMIPPQCPFERDITLFGQKVVHIPPLCKLNPLYKQLVELRFRALSYLADD